MNASELTRTKFMDKIDSPDYTWLWHMTLIRISNCVINDQWLCVVEPPGLESTFYLIIKCTKCFLGIHRCCYLHLPWVGAGIEDMGARSCLLLSYGVNMCFTFAIAAFFPTVTCTLRVLLSLRHGESSVQSFVSITKKEWMRSKGCRMCCPCCSVICFYVITNWLRGDSGTCKAKM